MPTQPYKLANGRPVPGVTTIIGSGLAWGHEPLMHWSAKMAREGKNWMEERDRAGRIGTITHARAEELLGGAPFDAKRFAEAEVAESEAPFKAFREWWEGAGLTVKRLEMALVSEEFCYGGTLDVILSDDSILDLKTSSQLRPGNIIQLAAYRHLWNEHLGWRADPPRCTLVHIPRGCKRARAFRVKPDALTEGFSVFQALHRIYRAQEKLALKAALEEQS